MREPNEVDLVSNEVQTWMENFLEELLIKNHTLDISAGTVRGDNYLGIIAKVRVKGEDRNGEGITLNLILKSAPRNEMFRSFAPINKAYKREIYIYNKVLPEFTNLQVERGLLQPFTSFAKYYRSTTEDLHEALIMEDMKHLGYELYDRHKPLDYNHTVLVMREYGKLHALSYAMRDQKPELFSEMAGNTEEDFLTGFSDSEAMRKAMREQSDKALNALDPIEHKVAFGKFKRFQENMIDVVQELVKSEPAGEYAVIGHGDSWVNNMLFKYENSAEPQAPTKVCLIDWQLSRLGSPALDLTHFLFACTDGELRDQHYDHFIQEYHSSLCLFLKDLGSDPDDLLPFAVLQEQLKKFSVYGLYMAIMVLFLVTSDAEEIPDLHSLTDEEDALQKFKFESKNVEKYNSRMRSVILDIIKYGYDF